MKNLLPTIELFKKSFDIYQKKVWLLVNIIFFSFLGLVVLLPSILIILLMSGFLKGHVFSLNQILFSILLGLVSLFFIILFGLWAKVALLCAVREKEVDLKKILSIAWGKLGSFFWISFLSSVAIMGGYLLLIVPGIIFSVWFAFSLYIFIAEGLKGKSALKRSKQLVQGIWWPVFGRIVALGVIALLISWIKFFGPIINAFFMIPFSVVYMYALYDDVKRVKD